MIPVRVGCCETMADTIICKPHIDLISSETSLCHKFLLFDKGRIRVLFVGAEPVIEHPLLEFGEDGSFRRLSLLFWNIGHHVRSLFGWMMIDFRGFPESVKTAQVKIDARV